MVTLLTPTLPDATDGSRLGGAPPVAIEAHPLLGTHRYLLTLGAGCADWADGVEVSVLIRDGFAMGDDDDRYPDMFARALVHAPSPRGNRADLGWPDLRSAALTEFEDDGEEPGFVRIAAEPELIQNEPQYADAVLADGHRFLFQINEEGWPVTGPLEDVIQQYIWGYGTLYLYGSLDGTGRVREVVAGFYDY